LTRITVPESKSAPISRRKRRLSMSGDEVSEPVAKKMRRVRRLPEDHLRRTQAVSASIPITTNPTQDTDILNFDWLWADLETMLQSFANPPGDSDTSTSDNVVDCSVFNFAEAGPLVAATMSPGKPPRARSRYCH
jgi:hypothetical protein